MHATSLKWEVMNHSFESLFAQVLTASFKNIIYAVSVRMASCWIVTRNGDLCVGCPTRSKLSGGISSSPTFSLGVSVSGSFHLSSPTRSRNFFPFNPPGMDRFQLLNLGVLGYG